MRISCPHCQADLNLGTPKPGKYKPTCKHCQNVFALVVTDDAPPKVKVGKLASSRKPEPIAVVVGPTNTSPEATMDAPGFATSGMSANIEATMDTVGGTAIEATMDNPAQSKTVLRTRDSQVASPTNHANETIAPGVASDTKERSSNKTDANSQVSVARGAKSQSPAIASQAANSASATDIPDRIGGYKILKLLGRGAMGCVYEAKQLSLDRVVALKMMNDRIARHPASLARFTREAYAAAQLTHHNVVQIYDFGEDDGKFFFSMEWVRGGPLDALVKQKGKLDPKIAATYILQAARGLQFAHQNGMVHRDIKPANILLSNQGVIKVADLGLVKIPDLPDPESVVGATSASASVDRGGSSELTMHGSAVGTPAYMSPEQCADASVVDHRADIYSLGCTLFYLVTGRPPFEGSSATEVMESHGKQPVPNTTSLNPRVSEPLDAIIQKALAKRPSDRFSTTAELIAAIESYLGLSGDRVFSPTSEQADAWEAIASDYATATKLKGLVTPCLLGGTIFAALLLLATPLLGISWLLLGPALLAVMFTATVLLGRGVVWIRLRTWMGTLSWFDWGTSLLGGLVAIGVFVVAGLLPGLIVGGILGGLIGAGIHFGIVLPCSKRVEPITTVAEKFLRDLRLGGADENSIRTFTSTYGGPHWQGLHEHVFGYESLIVQREKLSADPSFRGPISRTLRDRVCQTLQARIEANRIAFDQKRLAKIEEKGLQNEGLTAAQAKERAWQMAAVVMEGAKPTNLGDAMTPEAAAELKRAKQKAMLAEARSGKFQKKRDVLAPIKWILGGQTRLLLGCLLLGLFAVWGQKSGLFESIKQIDASEITRGNLDVLTEAAGKANEAMSSVGAADVAPMGLATSTSPWSIGIAGLLLIVSALFSGWKITPMMAVACALVLFGSSMGIPSMGAWLPAWTIAAAAGTIVTMLAIMFARDPVT